MNDIFHWLKAGFPAIANGQLTATKTDGFVFDRRDHRPGTLVAVCATVNAVATADASNYFELEVWESDEKASATALDGNATKVADADLTGYTVNAVRSRTANPAYDGTVPEPAQSEPRYLQNGTVPRINATSMAGSIIYFAYRGYKKCIQVRPTETGTADVTLSAFYLASNGETVNLVNPATHA